MQTMNKVRFVAELALGASVSLACSSGGGDSRPSSSGGFSSGSSGNTGAGGNPSGGKSQSSGSGSSGVIIGASGQTGSGGTTPIKECAADTATAQPAPLDMYIMLDISGSMLDQTASGDQKWAAVKKAIAAFLNDPGSAGIGVAIQYFPSQKAGVPAACTANDQCGSGGPCLLKTCSAYATLVPGGVAQCDADDDCKKIPAAFNYGPCQQNSCQEKPALQCSKDEDCQLRTEYDFGPCTESGQCENDASLLCTLGKPCGSSAAGVDLGNCVAGPSVCLHSTQCEVAAYRKPAVEFAGLPDAAAQLVASMEAQAPNGDTPTVPALLGAIEHAREQALAHSDHSVVAVLATDGLPTECLPDTQRFLGTMPTSTLVSDVAAVAADGVQGSPGVSTFVIGVFSSTDSGAPQNLAQIAVAGGTEKAQIVDTGGDVSKQFLDALNSIRKSRLACEFQIPAPTKGDKLDYFAVNVEYVDGSAVTPLYYVPDLNHCDADGGWYYDDPTRTSPSKILVCPSSCQRFQGAAGGSVRIKLGCATIVK